MASLLIDTMLEQRRAGIYQLHEFVVMPDHLHALMTATDISHAVQQLKGRFAHDAIRAFGAANIWPRGFSDHQVRDDEDYSRHQHYIWMNPVKAGLVMNAEEFPYSSASGRFELDPKPAAKAAVVGR